MSDGSGPVSIGLLGPPWRPGGRPGVSLIQPGLLVGEYPTPGDAEWLRDQHAVSAVILVDTQSAERHTWRECAVCGHLWVETQADSGTKSSRADA